MKNKWKITAAATLVAAGAQATMVTIGDAGNDADGNGYGAVSYEYKISDHEVTIAEMQAATGAGSGNENYWNDGTRTVGTGAPASYVSLYEAMKYCNYITSGNVNDGAYVFSGGVYQSTDRASAIATYGTIYAVPTEDEWYKAAYYTGNSADYWSLYADGTDTTPTQGSTSGWNYYNNGYVNGSPNYTWESGYGGVEQNGTYDMMGNVQEWMEDSAGVIRGGSYYSIFNEADLRSSTRYDFFINPSNENDNVGFRPVEVVPEPASIAMIGVLGGCALFIRRIFLI